MNGMRVVIVEDERPAAERLRSVIAGYDAEIQIAAHLQTVADTVEWFRSHPAPDLLFLDVRLTDGLSLEVFRKIDVACPVVFTTAYDAYVLDAFECNSIDYLLKPVKPDRLAQAFRKYDRLRRHFGGALAETVRSAFLEDRSSYMKRLVVQRGRAYHSMDVALIRYGFSEEKATFLVDGEGRQYLCDEALTSLEEQLDPVRFFRLNRQYLACIDAIASFRPAARGRLRVELDPPAAGTVVVSQARARRFRQWMEGYSGV